MQKLVFFKQKLMQIKKSRFFLPKSSLHTLLKIWIDKVQFKRANDLFQGKLASQFIFRGNMKSHGHLRIQICIQFLSHAG